MHVTHTRRKQQNELFHEPQYFNKSSQVEVAGTLHYTNTE